MKRLNGFVILTSLLYSTLLLAGFSEDSICKYDDGKNSLVVGTDKNHKPRSVYFCKNGISEPVAILRANKDGVFSKNEVYMHSEKFYGDYFNKDGLEMKHDPYKYEDELNLENGDVNQFKYVKNNPVKFTDPSGLVPGDPFPSTAEAAGDAINYINPTSINQNLEYGGYIFKNPNGTYVATSPTNGGPAGVSLGAPPTGTTADYHTHGGFDPRYDNEHFSPMDILGNALAGTDGYLGTPAGSIQQFSGGSIARGLTCH